jgi:ATP-dependent DNA helicase DinG
MAGVNLSDDMGRYNILLKVPYPQIDSATEYILENHSFGWPSYFDRAAIRIAQSYGRTTRNPNDWSNFYILDKDYEKVKKKASLPQWLTNAEKYSEVETGSVFDY